MADEVTVQVIAHPYSGVTWGKRDVILKNRNDGSVHFEQRGVEFPAEWSDNAVQIVASKYFRGRLGTIEREWSLRHLIDRVVEEYCRAGVGHGHLDGQARVPFEFALKRLILDQAFSFNSPVWFNVGTDAPQQCSACFLLSVEDSMTSILDWYREEGLIFKGGSGAGVNLSRIRSSKEPLSSGGNASGPVSFMRGADASAGTIKSGGATRRAAKLVCLDVDHPDVLEFIRCKADEERKIRALSAAGFDMGVGGRDAASAQYQNANNSVRVTNEFMRAVENGRVFNLVARTDSNVIETVDARNLFREMAKAAWECADPGIQYDDHANDWHTTPAEGRITTSNPCGEYLSLDNSSCNLASLNLIKFLRPGRVFDTESFIDAVELAVTAMDISVSFADYPTPKIARVTRAYRQLGLGYANLGALLMSLGLPYDSQAGRAVAAGITSLLTSAAYRRSAELAGRLGAYDGFTANRQSHLNVVRRHSKAAEAALAALGDTEARADTMAHDLLATSCELWSAALHLGEQNGYRNAQVTLLAPTGTTGLAMDVDTTGIEPAFALVTEKMLSDGGSMVLVCRAVPAALAALGYNGEAANEIGRYIAEHGVVEGAPHLRAEDYAVFDTAVGGRPIEPMGHLRMMAAVQPLISGAISKTINMPHAATPEDIELIYLEGWRLGLKSVAVYRDGCKDSQILSAVGAKSNEQETPVPHRRRLPQRRTSLTTSFNVGGAEGYLTAGQYPDGRVGEVFLKLAKHGSTVAGLLDAFSIAVSVALQYGVPLQTFVEKFRSMRFEPAGITNDPEIRIATSLVDYLFRRLERDFLAREEGAEVSEPSGTARTVLSLRDAPVCLECGVAMQPTGSCYACTQCGATSGCS